MKEISIMVETISLNNAISIIDRQDKLGGSVPFDITFRSLQRNSKTGGKLYSYNQAKKFIKKKYKQTNASLVAQLLTPETFKKNPNHFENRTRNLELQNGDIKKIHIRLIISINGLKVVY